MSKWNETIQQLETSPGWLDRNIHEAKKSLPPTDEQLAAARLAGKIEGMNEICNAIHEWNDDPALMLVLDLIRAKIAELEATTTPASPGSSDEK